MAPVKWIALDRLIEGWRSPRSATGSGAPAVAVVQVPRLDPELASLAGLGRRQHIEPFITSLLDASNAMTGELDHAQQVPPRAAGTSYPDGS